MRRWKAHILCGITFAGLAVAGWSVGVPPRMTSAPDWQFAAALQDAQIDNRVVWQYACFGNYIDQEYRFRLRLSNDELARFVRQLDLVEQPASERGRRPLVPLWWPKRASASDRVFTCVCHPHGGAFDGNHYFVIYDSESGLTYVDATYNF